MKLLRIRRQLLRAAKVGTGSAADEPPDESNNGVYLFGGLSNDCAGGGSIDNNDLFVPRLDTWATRAPINCPEIHAHIGVSVRTLGEEIIAAGGSASLVVASTKARRYVPDSWQMRTDMPLPGRTNSGGFGLQSKAWIVSGNSGPLSITHRMSKFFPGSNSWSNDDPIPQSLGTSGPATFVVDNKGYYHGGQSGDGVKNRFWEWSGTNWGNKAQPPLRPGSAAGLTQHVGFGLELSRQGWVATGSDGGSFNESAEVYRWGVAVQSWTGTQPPSVSVGRRFGTAAAFDNRGFLHAGIVPGGGESPLHEKFNSSTNAWSIIIQTPNPSRNRAAATGLGD